MIPVCIRLLSIAAVAVAVSTTAGAAGIVLERTNPWDAHASSLQEFAERVPASPLESAYKSYFRAANGRRFALDNNRIAKVVDFFEEAGVARIATDGDVQKLIDERERLRDLSRQHPVAKQTLERQIASLTRHIENFGAGHRKIAGKWLNPDQYKTYQREQERLAAEAKLAEERRLAEIRAAEEKRVAEALLAAEKRTQEQRELSERLRREAEEQEERKRVAKEKARSKKAAIAEELKRAQRQIGDARREAEQLAVEAADKYASAGKRRVTGQVFIATRGAQSYKFGAVHVLLLESSTVDRVTRQCDAFVRELARLAPQWAAADAEEDAASEVSGDSTPVFAAVMPEIASMTSGSLYYTSMPIAVAATETDADGRFSIDVPRSGQFMIAAAATRAVGEETETYFWFVPVQAEPRNDQVLLSSNNVLRDAPLCDLIRSSVFAPKP